MTYKFVVDFENGISVPEGKILSKLDEFEAAILRGETIPAIGQSELFLGLRKIIKKHGLKNCSFCDVNNKTVVSVDVNGNCSHYPRGWLGDINDDLLNYMLDWPVAAH